MNLGSTSSKQSPVLETTGLTKLYGNNMGAENISLQLHAKEVVGLIGPNGAGKSTTLRLIMGLTPATTGKIYMFGNEIKKTSRYGHRNASDRLPTI